MALHVPVLVGVKGALAAESEVSAGAAHDSGGRRRAFRAQQERLLVHLAGAKQGAKVHARLLGPRGAARHRLPVQPDLASGVVLRRLSVRR